MGSGLGQGGGGLGGGLGGGAFGGLGGGLPGAPSQPPNAFGGKDRDLRIQCKRDGCLVLFFT